MTLRYSPLVLPLLFAASALHGCSGEQGGAEVTDDEAPVGFTAAQVSKAVLAPGIFRINFDGNLITEDPSRLILAEQEVNAAAAKDPKPPKVPTAFDTDLTVKLSGHYDQGIRVSIATRPNAWADFAPVGAAHVKAQVRRDGSVVSFVDAYPGVTAIYTANSGKVEELLSVPSADKVPTLAYDITGGSELGSFRQDPDTGRWWAFAKDGKSLFSLVPPSAEDATGAPFTGSFDVVKKGNGWRAVVTLDLSGATFPVVIDPTFDSPAWATDATNTATARSAAAGAWKSQGGSNGCVVAFGGLGSGNTLKGDTIARCNGSWLTTNGLLPTTVISGTAPTARAYAAMASDGGNADLYMFGGHDGTGVNNELYRLQLSGTGTATTGTWLKMTPSGTAPAPRFMHGMAKVGTNILVFGGVNGAGTPIGDSFIYNPSTNSWSAGPTGFSGRYGFAAVPGTATSEDIYAIGGWNGSALTNTVQKLVVTSGTPASSWTTITPGTALIPTLPTGALDTTTNGPSATGSSFFPEIRYVGYAARTSSGGVLFGSGVNASSPTTAIADLWWFDPSLSTPRWVRHGVDSALRSPGARESPLAIYDEVLGETVLFGGTPDAGTTAYTDTRLYRGIGTEALSQTAVLTVVYDKPSTKFSFKVGVNGAAANVYQGTFASKSSGVGGGSVPPAGTWATVASNCTAQGLGTANTPLTGYRGFQCDINDNKIGEHTVVGVRLRNASGTPTLSHPGVLLCNASDLALATATPLTVFTCSNTP